MQRRVVPRSLPPWRWSPAFGGTAVAAGELITRGDQIAPERDRRPPTSRKSPSIARPDQQHPALRLRVRADGGLFGDPGDGTAKRFETGTYLIRFDLTAMTDDHGPPRERELAG